MILVAVRDLLFGSRIDAAARRLGVEVVRLPRGATLSAVARERRPAVILVDLGDEAVMSELRTVRADSPETRVVGFFGHTRLDLRDEARSIGLDRILTRGQLAESLDEVLLDAPRAGG